MNVNNSPILDAVLEALPTIADHHSPLDPLHICLKLTARKEVESLFKERASGPNNFGPYGELDFPYHGMGAIDSTNLFDLDELIIFSYYLLQRDRYKKVLDIGANLGLHSILLSKCGYSVRSFEPDSTHFKILTDNLARNNCTGVDPVNAAVSSQDGEMEFIRVLGNTTGSHLAGSKENPYGDLERFRVEVKAFKPLIEWADFIKMDVEGHEPQIIASTSSADWDSVDCLMEVESPKNAKLVFEHLQSQGVNMFAQKINWDRVERLEDMPTGYKEGSLFVSKKTKMPW